MMILHRIISVLALVFTKSNASAELSKHRRLGGIYDEALGSRIVGPSGTDFGNDSHISGNGKVIFVAFTRNGRKVVNVYDWDEKSEPKEWKPTKTFTASVGEEIGASIASSFDGNTVAVSNPSKGSNWGVVQVYERNDVGEEFKKKGDDIYGCPNNRFCAFGRLVAMSLDGNTVAAVGGSRPLFNSVWDFTDGAWVQRGPNNVHGNDGASSGSIVLSGDGNIVGHQENHNNLGRGTYKLFKWDTEASRWDSFHFGTPADINFESALFGVSSAISYDGKTLAIGSLRGGKVYIYKFGEDNTWSNSQVIGGAPRKLVMSGEGKAIAYASRASGISALKMNSEGQFESKHHYACGEGCRASLSGDGSILVAAEYHTGYLDVLIDSDARDEEYDPNAPTFWQAYEITTVSQTSQGNGMLFQYSLGHAVTNATIEIMDKTCSNAVEPEDIITYQNAPSTSGGVYEPQVDMATSSLNFTFGIDTTKIDSSNNIVTDGSNSSMGSLEFCVKVQSFDNSLVFSDSETSTATGSDQGIAMAALKTTYKITYDGNQNFYGPFELDATIEQAGVIEGSGGDLSLQNLTVTSFLCSADDISEVSTPFEDFVYLCVTPNFDDQEVEVKSLEVSYNTGALVSMVLKDETFEAEFIDISSVENGKKILQKIRVPVLATFFEGGNTDLSFSGNAFVSFSTAGGRAKATNVADFGVTATLTRSICNLLFQRVKTFFIEG